MKVIIRDISPDDIYYSSRKSIIGMIGDFEEFKPIWGNWKQGAFYLPKDSGFPGDYIFFHMVKVERTD